MSGLLYTFLGVIISIPLGVLFARPEKFVPVVNTIGAIAMIAAGIVWLFIAAYDRGAFDTYILLKDTVPPGELDQIMPQAPPLRILSVLGLLPVLAFGAWLALRMFGEYLHPSQNDQPAPPNKAD